MGGPGYSDTLLDHFRRPRGVGVVDTVDADGRAQSPVHGDELRLTFALEGSRIVDVRFQSLGCPVAIAAGSAATELLRGRTVAEALALTDDDVAAALGGIPADKRRCSVLVREAVHDAWRNAEKGCSD